MSAQILDGKILAQKIKEQLKHEIDDLYHKYKKRPVLNVFLVGKNASTESYLVSQKKTAESLGIELIVSSLPEKITQKEFVQKINEANLDLNISGIMIHQPLPKQLDHEFLINQIETLKDVEGLNRSSLGQLFFGKSTLIPCTPASVIEHLKSTKIDFDGKETVIIGRSEIVGKPLIFLLLELNLTVTVCHSRTKNLKDVVSRADVVVASVGKPQMVKSDWIKKGAVVIDVGINRIGEKILGDVDFEQVKEKAAYITPVPGGVGPLTSVMLMKNCLEAFKNQKQQG